MAKKIDGGTIEIKASAKGLEKISQQADKAGNSLKKTSKSAQSADRQLKGAANASSNSTKNFSKMSQGITGGLVPAYATLAANLFALDAAFRFLKGAADFRVLTEGQQAFAASTGIAYKSLAKDIQSATRGMVSFSEASQAAAIGRAAGLSSGQLRELSEAAFTVSVALGRDVTDSFNRLVRGVTKAEPELLDELGIILRLEEASTKYAAALGLNKNQLSIYQKSQAVVNEVLGQAEEKFGKINKIMDPTANALSQVGIAFDELLNKFRPMIATVVEPAASFIAANTANAGIAMGLFVSSILKSLIPSTESLRISQAAAAKARIAEIEVLKQKETELAAKVEAAGSTSPSQNKFARKMGLDKLAKGGKAGAAIAEGKTLTKAQISNLHSQHTKQVGMFKNMNAKKLAEHKKTLLAMTREHQNAYNKMTLQVQSHYAKAQVSLHKYKTEARKVFSTISVYAGKAGMFISGLMSWAAIIGAVVLAAKALTAYLNKDAIKTQEQFTERVDASVSSISTLNDELLRMTQVRARGLIGSGEESMLHSFEAVQSVDFSKVTKDLMVLGGNADLNQEAFNKLTDSFDETLSHLSKLNPKFKVLREELGKAGKMTPELQAKFFKLRDEIASVGSALKSLSNNSKEMVKQQNRLTQALPKVPYQDMLALMESNVRAYEELNKANKDYESQLVAETNKIKIYTHFQKQAVDLQKQMASAKFSKAFNNLAGGTTRDKQLKVEQQRLQVANEIHKLDMINLQIMTEADEKKLAALKQQQAVQLKMVESAQGMYLLEEKKSSLMFQTYNTVYKNLEADLGKAIGAGMRGNSKEFEKIGKNFTNTITDAIGGMLAEQLIEDTFGALFPTAKTIEQEIRDGAAKHAQLIKTAIEEGGFSHKNSITAATDQFTSDMYTIQRLILTANKETEEKRQGRLQTDLLALQDRMETAGKLTTLRESLDYMEEPEYEGYRKKQIMDTMLSTRQVKAVEDAQALLDESSTEAGKKKLNSELMANSGDFLGAGTTGVYTQSVKDASDTISRILNSKFEQFDKDFETNVTERSFAFKEMQEQEKTFNAAITGSTDIMTGIDKKVAGIDGTLNPAPKEGFKFDATTLSGEGIIYFDPTTGQTVISTPNLAGKIAKSLGTGFDPLNKDQTDQTTIGGEKPKEEMTMDKFSKNLNQFSGVIGMMGALTGNEEKTAKIMAKVAQIQLMIVAYERAKMAIEEGGGTLLGTIGKFFTGKPARDGGIMSKHGRSYAGGGVATGPNSGYGATLHGTEAVVPLPNNRSIPVEMKGKNSGPVNTTINVNMADGSSDTTSDEETGKQFAQAINMAVLEEIGKQRRPGGLLAG